MFECLRVFFFVSSFERSNFELYYSKYLDEWRSGPYGLAAAQQAFVKSTGASADDANLPPLPEGWTSELDEATGSTFYIHKETQRRTWVRPGFRPPPQMATGLPYRPQQQQQPQRPMMMGNGRQGPPPPQFNPRGPPNYPGAPSYPQHAPPPHFLPPGQQPPMMPPGPPQFSQPPPFPPSLPPPPFGVPPPMQFQQPPPGGPPRTG